MQPAWKYTSDNTKEDEHQNQNMFSPNVTMIPKSTTGLEDKPLLPSVFRPKSTLYTAPLNVVPKTYLGNTTGSLNNPIVPAIQIAPSQSYLSSAVAYSSSSNPNGPAIPKQNPVFSVNNSAILQTSYRSLLPHNVFAQNKVLLAQSSVSSLQPCDSSLYNHVPCEVSVQNIVPLPGNNVSSLVKPYTSAGVYNHAVLQGYEPLPPYHYGTGTPNTIANFDERCSNEFRNQNVAIPFESDVRPVLPMKLVSTVHSNLTEIDVSNQQNCSTVVYNKESLTYLASDQASDASIHNASLMSSTLGELTAYSSGLDSRRPFESNELDEQTDQHSTTPDITSFKTNALVEIREHSTGSDNRRPFFGEIKYSSDLRRSNSPLGNFREESSVLTNRESELTRDYRESRYHDRCYLNDSSKDVRPYLSDDHERLSYLEAREAAYSPNESRGYRNSSPSYDRVDKDLPRRLYSSDTNSLSSFDGVERSSYSESRHLPYWSKESRNYGSSLSYDSVGKDSPRRLYPRNRHVIDSRDELSERRAATDRHNYSSRVSSRSRSPVQRHRHKQETLARKSRERTQTPKEKYSVSQEKLRDERRRLSPGRKRDSPHSSQKRERRKSLSPRRKSSSVASGSSARSKGTDSSRLSERRRKPETNESLPSPKKSKEKDDKDKSMSRALKCFCLPEPYIERKFVYEQSSRYYQTSSSSQKSTSTATDNVAKLHKEFEDMLSKSQTVEDCPTTSSTVAESVQDEVADSQYVFELLDKPDDEDNDVSSGSDVDLEGYDVIDVYDSESSDEDVTPLLPPQKENKFKNQDHPRKLHSELWFNVEGELNHGKECLCSTGDKQKWIVHNVYPNEQLPKACESMGNNGLQLYHYWVTVFPHPNFMTENPTTIESNGRTYTFEGFSLLSHSPLDAVPRCFLTRFNFKYEIFFIQEPIPTNFCIRDLDLFSKFLFHDLLEMYDWKIKRDEESEENCDLFHFLPRFTHRISVSDDGCEKYELLSMRKVFEHLLKSHKPLITEKVLKRDRGSWKDFVGSCFNAIVTRPGWKPSSVRIDDIERGQDKDNPDPVIVHHGIRPVQLSFSGDPKCQKLMKKYLKMRSLITNKPDVSPKDRLQLIKMKLTLDNMKMKDSLRRNCCVRVRSVGMIKTGLNSDVTQHALLLPVLVHHVRYHLSLKAFDEKIGYVFKDRALLQLALTHPSYVMNYGTNPDHARNTLSNCGVKQPRYGDRRNRLSHTKKKGIVQLIDIMAKLEDLDGSQSFIQHNERLEFLGDAILEFISTCHLYYMFPEMAEGGLVTHRSSLVQNRHLAQVAKKLGLDNFMQFSHGPDLCHEEDMEHAMANCLEAILGAIYLDSNVNTVQKVFCKLAFDEIELRKLWCTLPRHPLQEQQPEGDRSFISSSDVLKGLVKLEEAIGVQFKHIRLLARAFTHPQVGYNNLTLGNNQRMELLGDSLVQWVVTDYLYRHFPEHHEGHLTLLRSSLVNRTIQAQIAGEIGLDQHVHFGVGPGVPKLRQKHMSDLFEAFLAALFVDKGIEPVEVFCKVCLFPRLRNVIVNQEWMDAKSQLQSCCLTQSTHSDNVPVYKVLKNIGSPNMKLFTVGVYINSKRLGTGFGDSIREAEMNAAQNALATNYFPEYARQKRVVHKKHKVMKRVRPQTK